MKPLEKKKRAPSSGAMGVLGLGKMGEAILAGSYRDFPFVASLRTEDRIAALQARYGSSFTTRNRDVAQACNVLILAVKPGQAQAVLREIRPLLTTRHEVVSICAGVTLAELRAWAGPKPQLVRAMPNTPCFIGKGITVLSSLKAPPSATVHQLFERLGAVLTLEEKHLDAVTGLSACGPAYVYLILEALSDAGVKVGLPRDTAMQLAAHTLSGSAQMVLKLGRHPASLKDDVTTPGGCTIDGLMALEEGKVRSALIQAVVAATARSKSLLANK